MTTIERSDAHLLGTNGAVGDIPLTASWRRRIGEDRAWLAAHLLSLGAAAFILLVYTRDQWFHNDEWIYILGRGREPSIGIFTPHNEHWSTLPALIYRGLLEAVGLRSYLPYIAVGIVLHLALTHLLWRACLRAGASAGIATSVAGVFAVLGAGSENLLWAFQLAWGGSLAAGWLAVLLHDHDGRFDRRDVAGWAASIVGLMFSGPALALVAVAAMTVALRRRRWLDTVLVVAVPSLVYVPWWFIAGRHHRGQSSYGVGDPWHLVEFVWMGMSNIGDRLVGIPQGGTVLLLVLLWWWLQHASDAAGRAALAAAGLAGAFVFFLMIGRTRAYWGYGMADLPRYLYVGLALLAPAIAVALSRALVPTRATRLVALGACAVVAVHNVSMLRSDSGTQAFQEQTLRREMAAYAEFLRDDPRLVAGQSHRPDALIVLTTDDMQVLAEYDWRPGIELSPRERLNVERLWQVGLVSPSGSLDEVAVTARDLTVVPTNPDGCMRVTDPGPAARLTLSGDGASADDIRVRFEAESDMVVEVRLRDAGEISKPRNLGLGAGQPRDLVSYAEGRTVLVTPKSNEPFTICGVEPEA